MTEMDYHNHTSFCDGESSPEEMVLAAMEKGITKIGLLTHSYTFFDTRYCIGQKLVPVFQAEVRRLKEKYRGRILILCGVEQDLYSDAPVDGFDYVIGSVHYIKQGNEYLPIDESRQVSEQIVRDYFHGDWYELTDEYYRTAAQIGQKIKPDIIGHFDIITKFNEGGAVFSEDDGRYKKSWKAALDTLIPYGIPFEINTGAMTRGYRSTPYPSAEITEYIRERGGSFVLSSDRHDCSFD